MTGVLFSDKLESGVIVPRDYQQSDVNESFLLWDSGVVGSLTRIFTGGGKCLGKDTPVLLYDGRIVPVQEVRVGDQLMGPDNLPRTVLSLARGTDQMFRIVPKSGMSWTCNSEHILTLKMTNFNVPSKDGSIGGRFSGEIVDIPLNEYLDSTISFRHIAKGFRVPIEFAERPVIVDPYFLGLWLGDGSSHEPAITTADEIILDVVKSVAAANGLTVVKKKNSKVNEKSKSSTYRLSSKAEVGRARNPLWKAIREYIPETKCIPIAYKVNCRRIQLEILAGLLDTDGHLHNGGYDFISKYEQLAQDVAFVARSLGLRAVVSPCIKTCVNTGASGTYFRVGISGDCSIIPVRLPWKKAGPRRQKKDPLMFGFSVEALGEGDYYGFTITGDGRFLLGDFTVTHNTLASSFKFKRWLERSPEHRCMVLSYEQQLVWQFAEEVRDFLGIEVGVEMSGNEIHPNRIPRVVVACRQSLMAHELATVEQREALATYGITDLGLLTKSAAKRALSFLKRGCDITDIQAMILQHNENYRANQETGRYSRLHKFDYRWPWLVVFDEAHKYSMRLATVGHVVEWFEKNPESRRSGITATPKRSDNVCIQSKLFPGVSIDYPYRDAVRDGYAVPFDQRFIQIEGVDFRRLKEESKGSIEKWDSGLDEVLNTEEQLAKLCQPMLDMVGNRQTLIFSPSVSMARNVAEFLNARVKCECSCATVAWYPTRLLGDGAKCVACGEFVSNEHVISSGVVARAVYGEMPPQDRRAIYADHQSGKFQFLSVCSLCKEGYNDPEIAAVAVFRPVSKAAASLAEQMKGRASRPERGCINGLNTVQERLEAIANSRKPRALVIDLVGITGLADCASTVQIFADGLEDEVVARAEEIALEGGMPDPQECIAEAQRQIADEKVAKEAAERIRQAREAEEERRRREAAERARFDAKVKYSVHQIGSQQDVGAGMPYDMESRNSNDASEKQLRYLHMLGMDFLSYVPTKAQAGRMITLLTGGNSPEDVAYLNHLNAKQWKRSGPSSKQVALMLRLGIANPQKMTPQQASRAIDRAKGSQA